jgi:hypothetical protein
MGNIIVGALFIIGGASGEYALKGTNSPIALMVLGVVLIAFGGYQLSSGKKPTASRYQRTTGQRPRSSSQQGNGRALQARSARRR